MNIPVKYIALDLDGTLTDSTKRITPRTLQALYRAQDAGAVLIIASGRPVPGISPIVGALRLRERGGYAMAYNGGEVRRIGQESEETIFRRPLPVDILAEVCARGTQLGLDIIAHRGENIVTTAPDSPYVQRNAAINGMPVVGVARFAEEVAAMPAPPIKLLMLAEAERLAKAEKTLQEAFAERLEICRSTPNFMEVVAKGVDKAEGLRHIMACEGADAASLMAFGDGNNDLAMIRYAGLGIAMGNATPELKAAAQYTTLDNDSDGIAHALEHFRTVFH